MRKKRWMSFLPGLLLAVFFSGVIYGGFEDTPWLKDGEYRGAYWPTQAWKSCRPEAVAMDSAKLMLVYPYVANPNFNTRGVVIIRKGYIVAEAYFKGYDRDSSHPCYSVTKSFTGALIGIALGKGILQDVSEPIYAYFPELLKKKGMHIRGRQGYLSPLSPRDLSPGNSPSGAKNRITTRHLLTMTSGIDWNEGDRASLTSDVLNMALQDDFVQYVLDKPMAREPGEHWNYSSGDSMLLSGIIHSALGVSAYEFGREHLFIPIGIPDIRWESDPVGRTIGGWGIEATVRECAKFGYLYSQNGRWEARQIIPAEWVYDSLQPANPDVTFYGYQWWLLPAFSGWEDSIVPRDTHVAIGLFEQQIFVIPSQELVIVRTADDFGSSGWNELEFLTMVLESILE